MSVESNLTHTNKAKVFLVILFLVIFTTFKNMHTNQNISPPIQTGNTNRQTPTSNGPETENFLGFRVGGFNRYTERNFTQNDIINIQKLASQGKNFEPSDIFRILNDCESILKESHNIDTVLSRLELAREKIQDLRELENYNLYSMKPDSQYFINKFTDKQDDILKFTILRSYEKTKADAQTLKTEKGRINRINKFFTNLESYDNLSNTVKDYINSLKTRENTKESQTNNINRLHQARNQDVSLKYAVTGDSTAKYNVNELEKKFFNAFYDSVSDINDNNNIKLIRMSNGRLKIHFKNSPIGSITLQGRKHSLQVLTSNLVEVGYILDSDVDDFILEIPAMINYLHYLKETSIENYANNRWKNNL